MRMSLVGHVESLWRYPVKSMRGEKLESAFIGFSGVYGDRLYAFQNSAAPAGFPYLTGRELEQMLLHQPRFRHPDKALPAYPYCSAALCMVQSMNRRGFGGGGAMARNLVQFQKGLS